MGFFFVPLLTAADGVLHTYIHSCGQRTVRFCSLLPCLGITEPLLVTAFNALKCCCCCCCCYFCCCLSMRTADDGGGFRSSFELRSSYVSATWRGTRLSWGSLEHVWNEFSDRREQVSGSRGGRATASGGNEPSRGKVRESPES